MLSCSLLAVALLAITSDAYNPNGVRKHTHMARHYIRPTTEFFSTDDLFSKPITAKDFDESSVRKFRRKLETFRDAGEFVGESFGDRIRKRTYKIDPYGWEQQKQESVRRPKLLYYEVLGLDSEATASEIKRSYRQMAKLFHPDANPHKDTTAHFTLLNRAYEVLTNPRLKQRYDRFGRRGIGTSAASDVIHASGIPPTQKKSYPAYQVAKSDSADVCWKGSGTSKILDLQPKRSQTTLFQAMNKNLIPPSAAPIRSRKPMRDLYSILGVQRDASLDEIRLAYQSLRELFDPETDKSREVYVRFHEVTRAYEILKHHDLRAKYDKYGFRALDNIRTMEERIARPTDMDPDSPYSANHNPHYTLNGVGVNETAAEGPVVPTVTRTVVATRPNADYEGASWMTTSSSNEESAGKKVFRIYRQIDPLPIEDTYSFQPAYSGPIPIIEISDDDEDWEEVRTSPIILPPPSTNNYDDDLISNDDAFPTAIPFPNLSVGRNEKPGASTSPSTTSLGTTNNIPPSTSIPTSATKAVVASRPNAAYQANSNSMLSSPTQPIANSEETNKVYRVYRQIDPLPLDQTYNFRPVAKATIPIIEIQLDSDDEEWYEDQSSEPIMLPPASKPSQNFPSQVKSYSQASMATNGQTTSTPSTTSRRTPINAIPTLLAPKVHKTTSTKPSIGAKDSKTSMPSTKSTTVDEPPRWSSYSYTKSSLKERSVEAIVRSPNSPSKPKKVVPNGPLPRAEHANPPRTKPDIVAASRKTVVATRPSAAYQAKTNSKESTMPAPAQSIPSGEETSNKIYRVYRQIDPLPLDQTYNFRPIAKATIPIIEIQLDSEDEEWYEEQSSEPIMLPPASTSSTAKRQSPVSIATSTRTTSTPPTTSRRTPINATPTLVAPKVPTISTKPSVGVKDTRTSIPPTKSTTAEEPPRWSSYSYTKSSLKGRSVEAIIRSPNLPSKSEKAAPNPKEQKLQSQNVNPPHTKPDVVAASRKTVVATRPSAAYQAKTNSKESIVASPVQPFADGDETTNKVYRVYRQIDPLPLDQTYNFRPVAKATIPIIEIQLDSDDGEKDISSEPIMLPAASTEKRQSPASVASRTKATSTPPPMARRPPVNPSPTMLTHISKRSSPNSTATQVAKERDLATADLAHSNSTRTGQDQANDEPLVNTSAVSPVTEIDSLRQVDTKQHPTNKTKTLFFVKTTPNKMVKVPIKVKVASRTNSGIAKPDQETFNTRQRNLADEAIPAMKHGATFEKATDKQSYQGVTSPKASIYKNKDSSPSVTMEASTSEPEIPCVDHTTNVITDTATSDVDMPSDKKETISTQSMMDTDPPIIDQEFTRVRTIPRQIDPLPIDETFGPKGTATARRALAHATSVLLTSDQDKSPSRYTLASHNAPDGPLGVKLAAILGVQALGRNDKSKSLANSRRPMTQLKATRQHIPDNASPQRKSPSAPQDDTTPIENIANKQPNADDAL